MAESSNIAQARCPAELRRCASRRLSGRSERPSLPQPSSRQHSGSGDALGETRSLSPSAKRTGRTPAFRFWPRVEQFHSRAAPALRPTLAIEIRMGDSATPVHTIRARARQGYRLSIRIGLPSPMACERGSKGLSRTGPTHRGCNAGLATHRFSCEPTDGSPSSGCLDSCESTGRQFRTHLPSLPVFCRYPEQGVRIALACQMPPYW